MNTYEPSSSRYDAMQYRRCGRSGLHLPAISLGLWQNFRGENPTNTQRALLRRGFDLGVTHPDLGNKDGPPYGRTDITVGQILREGFRSLRDELITSTSARCPML